ncbi:MAG: carbohydrate ABC transporter substrate-binding protein [Alphaproteobacteria bacterium]|nr:carbohydrate ABC transporter substrate-binding protein [Alphaproteobacteria bacterium]MCW5741532.1 carbohydrate ABC transporter substrate-binding protein [Alphaproteobacteria bacterium]
MTKRTVSRRAALAGIGAVGMAGALGAPRPGGAQGGATLRWWSTQSVPAQLAAYKFQIAQFEAANPGIKVVFEPTSNETYAAQLAAAFASGQVPNIVTHLPSFAVTNYWRNGLLEPFNDVIKMVGEDKFFPGANRIYEVEKGVYGGAGIGGTAANSLWLRTDLMKKAGIDKAPRTWDELRAACRKMQGGGIYGAPLPYAKNSMTSLVFICFVHGAGGQVFTPDLQIALDSKETLDALEFYKSMRELCPPGATGYSWGESLTAFVSGATATGLYTGRVLANVNAQNPGIKDSITCETYPTISPSVPGWTFNDFPSIFIPKAAKDMAATKKFAAHIFAPEGYIKQLHAAPGHVLPVLKTIAEDPKYYDNPIISKYQKEVKLMAANSAAGFNLGFETANHKPNMKAGEIINSGLLAELVQRVCLNNEDAKKVLGETAKKIEAIAKA